MISLSSEEKNTLKEYNDQYNFIVDYIRKYGIGNIHRCIICVDDESLEYIRGRERTRFVYHTNQRQYEFTRFNMREFKRFKTNIVMKKFQRAYDIVYMENIAQQLFYF